MHKKNKSNTQPKLSNKVDELLKAKDIKEIKYLGYIICRSAITDKDVLGWEVKTDILGDQSNSHLIVIEYLFKEIDSQKYEKKKLNKLLNAFIPWLDYYLMLFEVRRDHPNQSFLLDTTLSKIIIDFDYLLRSHKKDPRLKFKLKYIMNAAKYVSITDRKGKLLAKAAGKIVLNTFDLLYSYSASSLLSIGKDISDTKKKFYSNWFEDAKNDRFKIIYEDGDPKPLKDIKHGDTHHMSYILTLKWVIKHRDDGLDENLKRLQVFFEDILNYFLNGVMPNDLKGLKNISCAAILTNWVYHNFSTHYGSIKSLLENAPIHTDIVNLRNKVFEFKEDIYSSYEHFIPKKSGSQEEQELTAEETKEKEDELLIIKRTLTNILDSFKENPI